MKLYALKVSSIIFYLMTGESPRVTNSMPGVYYHPLTLWYIICISIWLIVQPQGYNWCYERTIWIHHEVLILSLMYIFICLFCGTLFVVQSISIWQCCNPKGYPVPGSMRQPYPGNSSSSYGAQIQLWIDYTQDLTLSNHLHTRWGINLWQNNPR